jgi:O-antigen/teichoic acid export membrane protein
MLQHFKPLARDSAIYALGNMSGKLVGFILTFFFYVKHLTLAEYGRLGTLEAAVQLIVTLSGLNLSVAFVRWYSDKEMQGRQSSAFFPLLLVIIFIAVFINICSFPFTQNISSLLFETGDYSRLVRLMFCSAGFELVGTIPAVLCQAQLKPMQYTRNIIIRLGVVLVCTVLFIVALDRKLEGIYEAQIIGGMVYIALFMPYIIKNSVAKFEKTLLIKMFYYSLPLFLSSAFGVLLLVADRFILNFITGSATVGVYSLGLKLANLLKMIFVLPIKMAVFPIMFQMADKPNAQRFYAKLMTYITFGLMFFVIAVSMFGQEGVKIITVGQPDYWDAYLVIPFISFGILFLMMREQTIYCLHIVKRTGVIASVVIFMSLLNLGLNILLIPFMGAIGAALSTLLSQLIYFGVMHYYAQRYYPVAYEFRKIFIAIGLGALFCLVAYLISGWSLAWRLCIKTALLASYPLVLYMFRCYDRNEVQALQGFWKKWRQPANWMENIRTLKF